MTKGNFHAGGESDYRREAGSRADGSRQRLERRFFGLVAVLCRKRGMWGDVKIKRAWRRVSRRHAKVCSAADTAGCLWLKA